MPVGIGELRRRVDVALGVVEIEPGPRIDALHRADHLRGEQDVVDRHDFGEQIDARLVIDAGIEENVVPHDFVQLGTPVVQRQAAKAAPMERHRAAAVRNDQLERGKILEQVGQDELHERHGVGVEIIRAGGVHGRIAAARYVDHRRHVELDHLLVERIPPFVGQRRRIEVAAGRIGIEIAADEAQLLDAALEFADRVLRRHARRLRQLADADEILRIQRADAVDQVVADLRPFEADALVADVMPHAGGARREDRQIGAALALQLELVLLDALADFVVGHLQRRARRHRRLVLGVGRRGLLLAEALQVLGLGGVVAVAVDDHDNSRFRGCGMADATGRGRDCQTGTAL